MKVYRVEKFNLWYDETELVIDREIVEVLDKQDVNTGWRITVLTKEYR